MGKWKETPRVGLVVQWCCLGVTRVPGCDRGVRVRVDCVNMGSCSAHVPCPAVHAPPLGSGNRASFEFESPVTNVYSCRRDEPVACLLIESVLLCRSLIHTLSPSPSFSTLSSLLSSNAPNKRHQLCPPYHQTTHHPFPTPLPAETLSLPTHTPHTSTHPTHPPHPTPPTPTPHHP